MVHDLRDELSGFGFCRLDVICNLGREEEGVGGQRQRGSRKEAR